MKRLAFLLLALPLAACATSTANQTASSGNCDPRSVFIELCAAFKSGDHPFVSHWDVATGRGAFLASAAEASAASTGDASYPAGSYGGR